MACNSCIKGNYDFVILELDKKDFLYQDISDWQTTGNFCKPEEYTVTVYFPGNTDPVDLNLSTNCFNKVGQEMVGNVIKDGVYYFSVEKGNGYCGKTFRKSVAVIPSLQCCFDKAFVQYSVFRKDELNHIDFLIKQVRHNALVGNAKRAEEYYDEAKSALNRFECDCSY